MSEFGNLDLDEMAGEGTRLKEQGGTASFLDQFVPIPDAKPGQTISVAVRILPPVKGGKLFQYNRVHTINGRKVHCPRPLVNNKWDRSVPCPICEHYQGLWKKIEKIEKAHGKDCPEAKKLKAEAGAIKPVERYYYNAIVRLMIVDGKEVKNVGPRILSIGKLLHASIIEAITGRPGDPESKLGNITDIKNGWDFVIRKEATPGQEQFPTYTKSGFARTQSPLGAPEEIEVWQKNLHDLTKLRNPKDVPYLEKELAIYFGYIADDTEGFDKNEFASRWNKNSNEAQDAASRSGATRVTVPAGVDAAVAAAVSSSAPVVDVPVTENIAIEDADFLKQLEGMGQ